MTSRSKYRKESSTRNYPLPSLTLTSTPPPIQDEFELLFAHLKQEIQEYHALVQSVHVLKQYVETGMQEGIFDREDMEWIDADIKGLLELKEKKTQELVAKETLYRNSIVKLENMLTQRDQIIKKADQDTNVLSLRPDLLRRFAKKRAHLMTIVDAGKRDLQKSDRS